MNESQHVLQYNATTEDIKKVRQISSHFYVTQVYKVKMAFNVVTVWEGIFAEADSYNGNIDELNPTNQKQ